MTLAQGYVRCAHCSAVIHVIESRLVDTDLTPVRRLCRKCWLDARWAADPKGTRAMFTHRKDLRDE